MYCAPYPIKRVGNGLDRSAKLHQNSRAGVETRPYNGAPSRRPVSPPSGREVAFAVGKRRRERNGKISPPVKCCAFDSPLSEGAETAEANFSEFGHLAAGAKFSEFGHPFVCFADISPIRGITPLYRIKLSLQPPIYSVRAPLATCKIQRASTALILPSPLTSAAAVWVASNTRAPLAACNTQRASTALILLSPFTSPS